MSLIKIAWRSIRQRALASGMTAFAMGLGVALVVTVLVIHSVIQQSFTRGTLGCNFIIGGKGSQYQLVLNTIFHVEQPLGNIPYKYLEDLQNRYSPIIETWCRCAWDTITRRTRPSPRRRTTSTSSPIKLTTKFEFAEGRNFKDENFFEAVIGSAVAQWLDLKIGDEIKPVAAAEKGHDDDHPDFKIVGILKPTGTANDRSVFIEHRGLLALPGA